ncbi:LPS assembly lipoprotein LptE [Telmatobacter sp. DSM 110680]|uniref:LPS assembly lipoprotein LptE n=1 Tax=Telmatobacter sp. DSM 110680 TaxID=3036704 RepID=A0AAU7DLD5_9BACT
MQSFCSSLLLLPVLMFSSLSAQECRPKIAIKTFANPANYTRSTIGNGLTEILTTELQNTGKFNILERSNIDEATKEMDFGTTDYAKGDTFARKGNLLGAQYLLMGKVTNFSYSETGQRKQKINLLGPNTIVIEYQQRADVRVDFRLIKVATGETVLSQAGDAHSTAKSEVSEYGLFQRVIAGAVTLESSSSLIGRATTDAVRDIVSKLNSLHEMVECGDDPWVEKLSSANPTIVAEEGGGLWILGGIGSADGLRVGDRLLIKHDNGVKDKSGKIIYHKLVDVGQMEVTDVGQADHAEARFTADAGAGGRVPQVNDPATVDMEHAKRLRGALGTQTDHPTDVTSNKEQLEQSIKRAESYMHDRFWSQALDEYKHAAALGPSDVRVLAGEALSHYALGDFVEGDGIAEKLIQSDGALIFPIAHYHGMNLCTGQLTIQKGKLAYTGGNGDGFDISGSAVSDVQVRKISKGMMANEKIPDLPIINIRFKDAGGKEKDYQMLPYMYSKDASTTTGKNLASAFPMGDSEIRDMQKFEDSVVQLIHKFVR